MDKRERLRVLISEIIEDGIGYQISELEDGDKFIITFETEYERIDLFDFMNDSACHILNSSDFEILNQDNRENSFIIKVLKEELEKR